MDELTQMVKSELQRVSGDVNRFCSSQKEKTEGMQAQLLDLQQKVARRGVGGGDPGAAYDGGNYALRALLDGSAELKAVADRKSKRAVIDVPPGYFNINAAITSTSGTGLAMPERLPGLVAPVTRRMTIRSLIPSIPTDAGSVQYTRETGFTNNAATVSETNLKPESTITFELKTTPIATIAHWIRTSAQVLSDTPMLQAYIDGRLRYGLAYVEETQLLKGSGVGNNLQGLYTAATAFSGATGSKIDTLRRAITQLSNTEFQATGIVLNPTDWEEIETAKTTTGEYLVGAPRGANPPTLWNLVVIPTSAMTSQTFLVADFPQAALIFDRELARVDISTETDDDFITNQCHIRAEERIGLAILRTGALIRGDFGS